MNRTRRIFAYGLVLGALLWSLSAGCDGLFDDPVEIAGEYPSEVEACETTDDCADDEVCNRGVCVDISCADVECDEGQSCYRGECLDECDSQTNCGDGERCYQGRCVSIDCSEVVCDEDERCYYGACHPTCGDDQDCENVDGIDIHDEFDPRCDNGVCTPPPCVDADVLPDGSPCPHANFATETVEDVGAMEATFKGAVYELPEPRPVDHGFCWSANSDEPAHGDSEADCIGLGEVDEVGSFHYEADDLEPGTTYHVRAWMERGARGGTADEEQGQNEGEEQGEAQGEEQYHYADDEEAIEFTTVAPPVENVDADQDADAEIVVTWDPVEGAVGYQVHRDGELVADPGEEASSWTDEEPDEADDPLPPDNFEASDREFTDRVELTWDAVTPDEAQRHEYTVTAVYPDTHSAPSDIATGWLAGPEIVGYRIFRGQDALAGENPEGAETVSASKTSYEDEGADPPHIEQGGTISATEGEYNDRVELEVIGASAVAGDDEEYSIYTVTDSGVGEEFEEATGTVGVGELQYEWQRTDVLADPQDGDFSEIATTSSATYADGTAPDDGSARIYRAVIHADGAESVPTDNVASGSKKGASSLVETEGVLGIAETEISLQGLLTNLGDPEPEEIGFCIGPYPEPSVSSTGSQVECRVYQGDLEEGDAFAVDFDDLTPGTSYYARAYGVIPDEDDIYGDDIEFVTWLAPPANLEADKGESTEEVGLNWDSVAGAEEYEIYRDGEMIAVTDDTFFDDEANDAEPDQGPDPAGPPLAPSVDATSGEHTGEVVVTWDEPEVPNGPSHSYTVVAVTDDADSPQSSWDQGYRSGYPIDEYRVEIVGPNSQGEDTVNVGEALEHVDDQFAGEPNIALGAASMSASQGEYMDYVLLNIDDVEVQPGAAANYKVRAINRVDEEGLAGSDDGYRGVGEAQYQWEGTDVVDEPEDSDFFGLATTFPATYEDWSAPWTGDERRYRAIIHAEGAESKTLDDAVVGYRASTPVLETEEVITVGETSVSLQGRLTNLGEPAAQDAGFCVGSSSEPSVGADECKSIGSPQEDVAFVVDFDNLDSGSHYYARAYADGEDTVYGEDIEFTTLLASPMKLQADKGEWTEKIGLTWEPVDAAEEYEVYRDGELIAVTGDTFFDDEANDADPEEGPDPAGPPLAPSVDATSGEHTDEVVVSWDAPEVPDGPSHSYAVVAVTGDAESSQSNWDEGYRSGFPIDRYEIELVGVQDQDSTTVDAGDELQIADDVIAGEPTISPGTITATDGTSTEYVRLTVDDATAAPGEAATYEVRAINVEDDEGAVGSDEGYRGVGALEYTWERSTETSDPSDGSFTDIITTSISTYDDAGAPEEGYKRAYRAVVDADGAEPMETDDTTGFRAAEPEIDSTDVWEVDFTSADVQASVSTFGAPDPTDHGFCLATTASVEIPENPAADEDCVSLGSSVGSPMLAEFLDLSQGTRYYVRPYVVNPVTGVATGETASFITDFSSPEVTADSGKSTDSVTITWDGVDGAERYEVFRDDQKLADMDADNSATSFSLVDDDADTPEPPAAPVVEATDGEYTDQVEITWNEPATPDGTTHFYTVVAHTDDTQTSGGDSGYRRAYDIDTYELQINNGGWTDIGEELDNGDGFMRYVDDEGAEPPEILPGETFASDGASMDHVLLRHFEAQVLDGPETTYEVRAINDNGDAGDIGQDTGFIGVGELEYQWLRSADENDGNYTEIRGATSAVYEYEARDEGGPEPGELRYYRVQLSAEGADTLSPGEEGVSGYQARIHVYIDEGGPSQYDGWLNSHWEQSYSRVNGISVNPDGIVAVSDGVDGRFCKVNADGEEIWCEQHHTDEVRDTAIDADGNVYTAGEDGYVCKTDENGQKIWCSDAEGGFTTPPILNVEVDPNGDVYANDSNNNGTICKLDGNNNGDRNWCATGDDLGWARVGAMALRTDGDLFYTRPGSEQNVCRFDVNDRSWEWCETTTDQVQSVDADADGNVFYGMGGGGTDPGLCKLDGSGTEKWCVPQNQLGQFSSSVSDVAVDPDGFVFANTGEELCVIEDTDGGATPDPPTCVSVDTISRPSVAAFPGVVGTFPDAWENW